MTIEDKSEEPARLNVEDGDRVVNITSGILGLVGIAGFTEGIIDLSNNVSPVMAFGVGTIALTGSAMLYLANHRDRGDSSVN